MRALWSNNSYLFIVLSFLSEKTTFIEEAAQHKPGAIQFGFHINYKMLEVSFPLKWSEPTPFSFSTIIFEVYLKWILECKISENDEKYIFLMMFWCHRLSHKYHFFHWANETTSELQFSKTNFFLEKTLKEEMTPFWFY